jgi:NAD(P)-dependent dehydrogenase (short-subunit alcohol dehydrogenase family)
VDPTNGAPAPARALDALLEASVVGSFTAIGYEVRRRLYGWQDVATLDMTGRTVLITGGNSGLGLVTATALARIGAAVRIVARDAGKGARAVAELDALGRAPAGLYVADLSSLDDVRRLAREIRDRERRLDVLVHNAGALLAQRRESADGHEMTFATMVLGPFLLTHELLPLLRATPDGARVLWISSGGMYTQTLDVDALEMGPDGYSGTTAYARAKRAQVVLAEEWAKRLRDDRVAVHAMHPGWADTPGLETGLPGFRTVLGPVLRSPDQGADTIVWLAAAEHPGRVTGRFWLDRAPRSTSKLVPSGATPRARAALWDRCERLSGVDAS